MIDRGDLAAEIGYDRLYDAINQISDHTKAHGKALIMVTENLETMLDRRFLQRVRLCQLPILLLLVWIA